MLEFIVIFGGFFPALGEISRPVLTHTTSVKCVDLPSRTAPQNFRRGEFVSQIGPASCDKGIVMPITASSSWRAAGNSSSKARP